MANAGVHQNYATLDRAAMGGCGGLSDAAGGTKTSLTP